MVLELLLMSFGTSLTAYAVETVTVKRKEFNELKVSVYNKHFPLLNDAKKEDCQEFIQALDNLKKSKNKESLVDDIKRLENAATELVILKNVSKRKKESEINFEKVEDKSFSFESLFTDNKEVKSNDEPQSSNTDVPESPKEPEPDIKATDEVALTEEIAVEPNDTEDSDSEFQFISDLPETEAQLLSELLSTSEDMSEFKLYRENIVALEDNDEYIERGLELYSKYNEVIVQYYINKTNGIEDKNATRRRLKRIFKKVADLRSRMH